MVKKKFEFTIKKMKKGYIAEVEGSISAYSSLEEIAKEITLHLRDRATTELIVTLQWEEKEPE